VGNRVLVYDAVDGDLLHALKGHKVCSVQARVDSRPVVYACMLQQQLQPTSSFEDSM
jgi:hypothetical protein